MKISSILIVSLLMLITGILLSCMLAKEEVGTIINQPIFAQLGMPSSNNTLRFDNKTGEAEPLGGNK